MLKTDIQFEKMVRLLVLVLPLVVGCSQGFKAVTDGTNNADSVTPTPTSTPTPTPTATPTPNPSPTPTPTPTPTSTPTPTPSPTITNTGTGPTAPTNFAMTGQGQNSISLAWSAATRGVNAIASYKIYRNGVALTTVAANTTTYTDNSATNATTPGYGPLPTLPATIYTYDISAVDSAGVEGPKAAQFTAWFFHNGVYYGGGETMDFNYNGALSDYGDTTDAGTAAGPEGGPYDIKITQPAGGIWQPISGGLGGQTQQLSNSSYPGKPFLGGAFLDTNPSFWAMEVGAFNYMTIDLKATTPNATFILNLISRDPLGDNFNNAQVTLPGNFCVPAPAPGKSCPPMPAGQWATYKIPFRGGGSGESLQMGLGKFTASISNGNLVVTSLQSGIDAEGASWISGAGIPSGTFIGVNGGGGVGSYLLCALGSGNGSCNPLKINVSSTTVTTQRTNLYKWSLILNGGGVFYVDQVGFTAN